MTDLKQFSAAALAAITQGDQNAGTDSSVVNNYARSAFGNILSNSASGVGVVADAQAQAEKAAAAAAVKKLQDQNDPSKYQKIRKDDGGFEFLDPSGKSISVSQWAKVTGATRAEALDGSENPLDQQFLNDYDNMRNLSTYINNGDSAKISTFLENNKAIDAKRKPQELMQDLAKKYPHIFGNGTYADSTKNLNKPLFSAGQLPGSDMGGSSGSSTANYNWDM